MCGSTNGFRDIDGCSVVRGSGAVSCHNLVERSSLSARVVSKVMAAVRRETGLQCNVLAGIQICHATLLATVGQARMCRRACVHKGPHAVACLLACIMRAPHRSDVLLAYARWQPGAGQGNVRRGWSSMVSSRFRAACAVACLAKPVWWAKVRPHAGTGHCAGGGV